MTALERKELMQRHRGALKLLLQGVAPQRREILLSHVVWPTEATVDEQRVRNAARSTAAAMRSSGSETVAAGRSRG